MYSKSQFCDVIWGLGLGIEFQSNQPKNQKRNNVRAHDVIRLHNSDFTT